MRWLVFCHSWYLNVFHALSVLSVARVQFQAVVDTSRDHSLADHTLPTRPSPAWQPENSTTQPVDIEEEGLHPTMDRKWLKESLLDEHVFTIPFSRVFDRKKRWRWCIQHWTTWLKVCVSPCASSFAGFGLKCWIKEVYLEYQPLRPSYESSWKQATDLVKPSM